MISVCLATYNGESFLKEQIDSIHCQLSLEDEIIVSDDGSSDKTIEILNAYGDSRIKIYKGPCQNNPALNFENALAQARGDYIFLSDQDDVWELNKVEVCLKYLKNYDLVLSDCSIVDRDLQLIYKSFFDHKKIRKGFIANLVKNNYSGCRMAFRREILQFALPFPPKIAMHDMWIGLCAELFFYPIIIEDKLIKYRRHGLNVSATSEKSLFSLFYKIRYRLYFISQLVKLFFLHKK